MRLIWVFTLFLFIVSGQTQAKEWRLALCYGENATEVDKKYRNVIGDMAVNTFGLIDEKAELSLMTRKCVKEPELACYADKTAIFCREEPLALISRISAWLAAEGAFIYLASSGDKTVLNKAPGISWVDALLLADAEKYDDDEVFSRRGEMVLARSQLSADSLNAIYSLVNDLYLHTNNDIEVDSSNDPLVVASQLYRAINEYAFAFLLGHEGYHYNGNRCHISEKASIERSGVYKEIVGLQLKKGLFDHRIALDKHELNADLCGFKWIEKKAKKSSLADNGILNALSKRIAIDLLASPLLTGYLNNFDINQLGQDAPKVKLISGYLYPQSRLVLASATLQSSEKLYPEVVKICNDTAKALVSMVQDSYRSFPNSSGIIPDSLLAQLPPTVEESWNGKPWTENSYLCKLSGK